VTTWVYAKLERLAWWLLDAVALRSDRVAAGSHVFNERSYVKWLATAGPDNWHMPLVILHVDDLGLGGIYHIKLSPAQAFRLCNVGIELLVKQRSSYNLEDFIDWDVRGVRTRDHGGQTYIQSDE